MAKEKVVLNTKANYKLVKVAQERANPNGIPDSGTIMDTCKANIVNGCLYCTNNEHSDLNDYDWFRSSLVQDIKPEGKNVVIKTMNSTYKLIKL